jgi:hypothetical protein
VNAIIDFADRNAKGEFLRALSLKLGVLTGSWKYEEDDRGNFSVRRWRPRRSNQANAYYWAAVVPAFQAFLRDQGQFFTKDEIHEFLKAKLLPPRELIDPKTGEVLGTLPARSSEMDSDAFARFVNDVIDWLASMFGIVVPPAAARW